MLTAQLYQRLKQSKTKAEEAGNQEEERLKKDISVLQSILDMRPKE